MRIISFSKRFAKLIFRLFQVHIRRCEESQKSIFHILKARNDYLISKTVTNSIRKLLITYDLMNTKVFLNCFSLWNSSTFFIVEFIFHPPSSQTNSGNAWFLDNFTKVFRLIKNVIFWTIVNQSSVDFSLYLKMKNFKLILKILKNRRSMLAYFFMLLQTKKISSLLFSGRFTHYKNNLPKSSKAVGVEGKSVSEFFICRNNASISAFL